MMPRDVSIKPAAASGQTASVVAVALHPTPLTYFAAFNSARCSSGKP
jgi:hypothetical protein